MIPFLTNTKESKEEYIRIMQDAANAASCAFTDDLAYSGPSPEELKRIIHQDNMLPEKGEGWKAVLEELKKNVLPNMVRPSSVRYMAHLHSAALLESLGAETLLSTFNQSMDSWDQAPAATEIEIEVTDFLCKMYGYDGESDGVFTSGGSQSNQTAIILARDWFCNNILHHDVKKFGLPDNYKKLRMYTSCISHFSMEKSAHILGLGYESVVKVPVDSRMKMNLSELKRLIEKDKSEGNIPFLVVGTIGTTDFGSIDPIKEIAELSRQYGLWFHADAAYGSGVILSDKYKNRIDGLNRCDSITVDFHKMFSLPISASAVLVKDKKDFEALTIHADYLNREEDEEDGYTNLVDKSLQTTRRFDALKVWTSFKVRGKEGMSSIIETSIENAFFLYETLSNSDDFETITKPEISSVVFRYAPKNERANLSENDIDELNKKIRRSLIHKTGTVIGQTVCNSKVFLKCTLLNPIITHKSLEELINLIRETGKQYL